MSHFRLLLAASLLSLGCVIGASGAPGAEPAQAPTVDGWSLVKSDGVAASLAAVPPPANPAPAPTAGSTILPPIAITIDFSKGSGYAIARRELAMDLPENWQWSFRIKGDLPPNNLEFKLYDETGENVWWTNRRAHEFVPGPGGETIINRKRQVSFAWGPGGAGKPLKKISAVEIGIAAAKGGTGTLTIEDLTFTALPAEPTTPPTISMTATGWNAPRTFTSDQAIDWKSTDNDPSFAYLNFGPSREMGGVAIGLVGRPPDEIQLESPDDGDIRAAQDLVKENCINGGDTQYLIFPDGRLKSVRLSWHANGSAKDNGISKVRFLDPSFAESPNERYRVIAGDERSGLYPPYFLGEPVNWTVIGTDGGYHKALMSDRGVVELDKQSLSVEPFIFCYGKLLTWAEAMTTQSLEQERLPIPTVTLNYPEEKLRLDVTAFADADKNQSQLSVRYRLSNFRDKPVQVQLLLAARPFQVLPPWQDLNMTGGVVAKSSFLRDGGAVNAQRVRSDGGELKTIVPITSPFAPALAHEGALTAEKPNEWTVFGPPNADILNFNQPEGTSILTIPAAGFVDAWASSGFEVGSRVENASSRDLDQRLSTTIRGWQRKLSNLQLILPESAKHLTDSFYANTGYILVNRHGPGLQPGSRTYDRTWIRDGSLEATALLYTGHADVVKQFLDWFKGFQYENGKIPCCVDSRGPDPVPENDSHGQYLYAVATYHRFTHDTDLLKRHWSAIVKTVAYIEQLRATRMTDEYLKGPPEMKVKFGLLPESISHEGYSAKPMHSYWDDIWTLRGLKDATYIAQQLGEKETAAKWAALRDDFAHTLLESISLARQIKGIDYVPGCAELGDFDATSTAAAIFPGGLLGMDPALGAALDENFARYIKWFRDRAAGRIDWKDYTPYEIRNASALLMLGHPEQANEVLEWMLGGQSVPGWREWPEIVYKDKSTGRFIGDMPHTWVGSDFIKAVRNLCVYEREHDQSLVIGAGLKPEWLSSPPRGAGEAGGVTVWNFPTEYGPLHYTARTVGNSTRFTITDDGLKVPPGGIVVRPMVPVAKGAVTVNGENAMEVRSGPGEIVIRKLPAVVEIESVGR